MITVVNGYQIASDCRTAKKGSELVHFSDNESIALRLLLTYRSEDAGVDTDYVPKDVIEQKVWGALSVSSNSIRKLMSDIRAKLDGTKEAPVIENSRNRGYRLNFEQIESAERFSFDRIVRDAKYQSSVLALLLITITILLATVVFLVSFNPAPREYDDFDVLYQSLFETDENIYNYDFYKNDIYLTTSYNAPNEKPVSKILRITKGKVDVLKQTAKSGYYTSFKISPGGTVAYMSRFRDDCEIKISDITLTVVYDEIKCIESNYYSDLYWLDDETLYFTMVAEADKSARPYKYSLKEHQLSQLNSFDYDISNGFGSYAIKVYDGYVYTLSIDENGFVTLNVNSQTKSRVLYEFKNKPLNFEVSDNDLIFVNERNQVIRAEVPGDPINGEWEYSVLVPAQTLTVTTPTLNEGNLTYISGKGGNRIIVSSHSDRKFVSDNNVLDFYQNGNELAVLGATQNGYKIDLYKDDLLLSTSYHRSVYALREIASKDGEIYVGGSDGLFKVTNMGLLRLTSSKTQDIVTGDDCVYISTNKGVEHLLSGEFVPLSGNSKRIFGFGGDCMYEDMATKDLVYKKGVFGNTKGAQYIFQYKGHLSYKEVKPESGHYIVSLEDERVIGEFEGSMVQLKYQGVGDEILFLTRSKTFNTIQRIQIPN